MPHIFDLPGNLPESLNKPNVKISAKVIWSGSAKVVTGYTVTGSPIFSTTYQDVTVDMTSRINTDSINISLEKPIMPQEGQNLISASEISISLINTDTYIATTQDGAIMETSAIEGGRFHIWATITGASPDLDMYRGRVTAIPDESFGITTFKIKDIFWEALKKPLVYEYFQTLTPLQNTYVNGGNLFNSAPEIVQGDGYMKPFDGYCAFTEDGEVITTVEVSDRTKIEMLDIIIKNGAPLGTFTFDFTGGLSFRMSHPDGTVFYGDCLTDFETDYIKVIGFYWEIGTDANGALLTDLKGCKITFQVRNTIYGNPVTIIKNHLEKALLGNYGDVPSDTTQPGFAGANLPIEWETFDDLEEQWKNYRVYFSESNKDNKVFERTSGNKPINALTFCQYLADHIGASILINNLGNIYIQGAKIGETTIHDLTGVDAIVKGSFRINSNTKPNIIYLNYGRNDRTDNYGAKKEYDLRSNPDYDREEFNLNLPYFKVGVSKWKAEEIAEMFIERNLSSLVAVAFDVTPQYGIALMPGDRVRIISTEQPKMTAYFEIFKVDKRITATGSVAVQAFKIQDPEGKLPTLCDWVLCVDVLC